MYKPPTRVVTRSVPYQALVTEVDPSWAFFKYREPEYLHGIAPRRAFINPETYGAYNRRSNVYPVGAQQGSPDPALAALSVANIGGGSSTGTGTFSFTTTAAVPAGALVLVAFVDGDTGPHSSLAPPVASQFADAAGNAYNWLPGGAFANVGAWFGFAWTVAATALGVGSTIRYTSLDSAYLSIATIAASALCVSGGFNSALPFDPALSAASAGSSSISFASGKQQSSNELLIAMAGNGGDYAYTVDSAHGWTGLQQFGGPSAGAYGAKIMSTSYQALGVIDPGAGNPVTFSPAVAGTANWGAMIIGIAPNVPMVSSVPDGKGWA